MLMWLIRAFHDLPGRLSREEDSAVHVEGLTRRARHDLVEESISGWLRTRVDDFRTLVGRLLMLESRLSSKPGSAVHAARSHRKCFVRDIV